LSRPRRGGGRRGSAVEKKGGRREGGTKGRREIKNDLIVKLKFLSYCMQTLHQFVLKLLKQLPHY